MPDRRERENDRLEREINEILSNIEQFPDADQRKQRARRRVVNSFANNVSERQRTFMRRMSGVSLSQLMILSFLIILGSMFFREIVRVSWPWMMYAGVVLFLTTFALMMFGGSRGGPAVPRQQQYWRGRPVSYRQDALAHRMRRWFGRRSRR
jgi:hypothetical protein